jgi:protoheme IX farnesyltransferase
MAGVILALITSSTNKWMNREATSLSQKIIKVAEFRNRPSWFADILVLTKLRVNLFVIGTAFVGFALNTGVLTHWLLLVNTLIGTGLVAGSAAAANQVMETEFDRDMARTQNRPLAAGRLGRRTGIIVCATFLLAGCFWLGVAVNLRAMSLALLTFLMYAFAYTPMKRYSPACLFIGAIPGALPILIGWAATGAAFGLWTMVAFGILFLWQIPHFLAIAWWRKEDYLRAGFQVLRHDDQRGYRTAGCALIFEIAMVGLSLVPVWLRRINDWYLAGGLVLGTVITLASIQFLLKRNESTARTLFITSLFYLPGLYLLMLLAKR